MTKATFIEGKIETHIWQFALPMFLSLIVTVSFSAADTYFLSRLGHIPLTAISFILPIMQIVNNLSLGLGIAVSIRVANSIGQQDHPNTLLFGTAAIAISLLLASILVLIGYSVNTFIFVHLLAAPPSLMPLIDKFTNVWYAGIPLIFLLYTCIFLLRAHGRGKMTGILTVILAIINLILDPILIFGYFGSPKYGMEGAAMASLIARGVVVAIILVIIFKSNDFITTTFHLKQCFDFGKKLLKTFIPTSLTNLTPAIAVAITTYLLASISPHAVAAFGVASNVQAIALIPLFALSGALNPIISQNYGSNKISRSLRAVTLANNFSILWGTFIAILLFIIRYPIAHIFTHNLDTIHAIALYFEIIPISFTGWGIIMMTCANFNGMHKPSISSWITFIRMIAIFVPLAWILKFLWGYNGIYVAFSTTNLIVGIACIWLIKRTYYRELSYETT